MSNRKRLRDLVRKHPDWTNRQYADCLGQGIDTIRGALSSMGLSRFKARPPKEKKKRRKVEAEAESLEPIPSRRPIAYIASKAGPTRFGYLKLM